MCVFFWSHHINFLISDDYGGLITFQLNIIDIEKKIYYIGNKNDEFRILFC